MDGARKSGSSTSKREISASVSPPIYRGTRVGSLYTGLAAWVASRSYRGSIFRPYVQGVKVWSRGRGRCVLSLGEWIDLDAELQTPASAGFTPASEPSETSAGADGPYLVPRDVVSAACSLAAGGLFGYSHPVWFSASVATPQWHGRSAKIAGSAPNCTLVDEIPLRALARLHERLLLLLLLLLPCRMMEMRRRPAAMGRRSLADEGQFVIAARSSAVSTEPLARDSDNITSST
jgi:hypothetical protein